MEDNFMEQENFPPFLVEQFIKYNGVIFAGPLLSAIAGLPSLSDLTLEMSSQMEDYPPNSTAQEIAQYFSIQHGRFALIKLLRKNLDVKDVNPATIHSILVNLSSAQIFTTNYDDLFERACTLAKKIYSVNVSPADLFYWQEDALKITKLCGDINQPSTLLITIDDLDQHFISSSNSALVTLFNFVFNTKTILFLGYDVNDPIFRRLMQFASTVRDSMHARPMYVILFNAHKWTIKHLAARNIDVLNIIAEEPLTLKQQGKEITNWLHEFSKLLKEGAPISYINKHGKKWAVLVGASEYEDTIYYGDLQVCERDAVSIRDQLIDGGFIPNHITLLTDATENLPTRDNILASLKAVADATEPDDLILFYYSGHGDVDFESNDGCLVGRNGRYLVLGDTAVRLSRVKEILGKAKAKAKVIILDACHSGADIGSKGTKPMSEDFIKNVFTQAEGIAILSSCTKGQISYEWKAKERSVFTHFFLDALSGMADFDQKGFVTVNDVYKYVLDKVKTWAVEHTASQTPTLISEVIGEIVITNTK